MFVFPDLHSFFYINFCIPHDPGAPFYYFINLYIFISIEHLVASLFLPQTELL